METNKRAIYILNDLLEKNYDAELGYRSIAEDISESHLKALILQNAEIRQGFAIDLAEEIIDMGGKPVSEGSSLINLQLAWINFKAIISFIDEKDIIRECIKGEEASLKDYHKALKSNKLDDSTEMLLEEHREEILESIKALESLESTGEYF
jgi:uncharacterized protein (TIGR02284 family)